MVQEIANNVTVIKKLKVKLVINVMVLAIVSDVAVTKSCKE